MLFKEAFTRDHGRLEIIVVGAEQQGMKICGEPGFISSVLKKLLFIQLLL